MPFELLDRFDENSFYSPVTSPVQEKNPLYGSLKTVKSASNVPIVSSDTKVAPQKQKSVDLIGLFACMDGQQI